MALERADSRMSLGSVDEGAPPNSDEDGTRRGGKGGSASTAGSGGNGGGKRCGCFPAKKKKKLNLDDVEVAGIEDTEAEQRKQRHFYFRINGIVATFESKLANAFMEITVGGQRLEVQSTEAVEKVVKRKVKDKDGNETEKEEKVAEYKTRVQIIRPYAGRFFTRSKGGIKAKEAVHWGADYVGQWDGRYSDLDLEPLVVTVWNKRWTGANELIGSASELLVDIAKGKVERELYIFTGVKGRREIAVSLEMRVEFQELFDFHILFRDWEISLRDLAAGGHAEEDESDPDDDDVSGSRSRSKRGWRPRLPLGRGGSSAAAAADGDGGEGHEGADGGGGGSSTTGGGDVAPKRVKKRKHLITFTIENVRRNPLERLRHLFTSAYDMPESAALKVSEGTTIGSQVGDVLYRGTRAWLEEENLIIEVRKRKTVAGAQVYSAPIARKAVHLLGVLDHGYIMSQLSRDQSALAAAGGCSCYACLTCLPCCRGAVDADHPVYGTSSAAGPDAAAAGGELALEGIDGDAPPPLITNTVQVRGVVSAKLQPRYRQEGNVGRAVGGGVFSSNRDTYLVVKVVRAKGLSSTDEYKEQLNPRVTVEWAGVRKTTRTVRATNEPFFDEEVSFKVPDVLTGDKPPVKLEDFGPIAQGSTIVLSVWDVDGLARSPMGYAEVDFSTIYQKRWETKVESSTRKGEYVKRWVYKAKRELILPSYQVTAEDFRRPLRRAADEDAPVTNSTRYIEFLVYFERGDRAVVEQPHNSKALNAELAREPDNPYNVKPHDQVDPTPMTPAQMKRAQAFWDETLKNVSTVKGRNFAFMGKDELTGGVHFLPTFLKKLHPPTEIQRLDKLMYYISCIEFAEKPVNVLESTDPDSETLAQFPNTWVYSDPFFFLERKRGDVKDHAMLLCCFLLGLGLDAYVCIGRARTRNTDGLDRPHAWVMTVERCGTGSSSYRQVRFWETTTGKTYVLPDERKIRFKVDEKKPEAPIVNSRAATRRARMQRRPSQDSNVSGASSDASNPPPVTEPVALTAVSLSEMETTAGEDDGSGTEAELKRRDRLESMVHDYVTKDAARVPESKVTGSATDVQRRSRVQAERRRLNHQRNLLDPLKLPELKREMERRNRHVPYAEIDVVFNGRHLWANLQEADPAEINYNFRRNETRWAEFTKPNWQLFLHTLRIAPFYADRTLQSLEASRLDADRMQAEILDRIRGSMRSHREYRNFGETEFYTEFLFTSGSRNADRYLMERLRVEQQQEHQPGLRRLSRVLVDGKRADDGDSDEEAAVVHPETGDHIPDVRRYRSKWCNNILDSLDRKSRYRERLLHFKTSDSNKISDVVVEQCLSMLEIPSEAEPMYAVAVLIERLPAYVSPTRVLVIATYNDEDA